MTFRQSVGIVWIAAVVLVASLHAQSGDKYSIRLGRIPVANAREGTSVTGRGAAAATLAGNKLSISGSFDGLSSPATLARLHRGIAKGARGPVLGDLIVSKGPSGTFSGAVDLTPEDVADLKLGKLYVQIHSEKGLAPDGSNLWGWLLR
jgi:hypothetical protein